MAVRSSTRWALDADVVVVGYGGAGSVSAITAREAGADVLILEKQPQSTHHTNTSMSGGAILCPTDVESGVKYMEALCQAGEGMLWTDREMIRVWAEQTAGNRAWVEARGGSFLDTPIAAEYRELPGVEAMVRYRFRGAASGFTRLLAQQVEKLKIPVRYATRAKKLLTDSNGTVIGVQAESEGRTIRVRATRGVILTCGGFEFDERLKLNYLKVYPTWFTGSEANTGDGVRLALGVGADLWHMNCCSAHTVMKFPDFPQGFYADLVAGVGLSPHGTATEPGKRCGYIVINRYGKRIINEDNFRVLPPRHAYYYELPFFDSQRLAYPRVPSFWIFDSRRLKMGPLTRRLYGAAGPSRLYEWSEDNSREIARGWVMVADSISDLARQTGIPDLADTVARYNQCCQAGSDPEFGRNPTDLVPIDQPPYGAVSLWPGGANTQGGPRRSVKAEVLNADGEPIKGLYSAGELGSVYGMLYPGAGNLAECIAFGRIAGENAAKRKWDSSLRF